MAWDRQTQTGQVLFGTYLIYYTFNLQWKAL